MPAKKTDDQMTDSNEPSTGDTKVRDEDVKGIKMSESKVVVDDRQVQLEEKLAEGRAPETVNVEAPVPGNVDTEAFKQSVELRDTPDEELTLEEVHRKHHPQWFSDVDNTKSSDPVAASGANEDDNGN